MDLKDLEATAKKLAKGHGYHETSDYKLTTGFTVPRWVTFISRAEQIEQEREALK